MSIRDLRVISFGGHDLATKYLVRIPEGIPPTGEVDVQYAARYENFPIQSGKILRERTLTLNIEILAGGSADELLAWFDPTYPDDEALVAVDGSAVQWYMNASVKKIPTLTGTYMIIELGVGEWVWKTVTPTTESWNVAASGATHTVTNGGALDAYPVISITPGGARAGGFDYARFVVTYNQTTRGAKRYPINVVGTVLDHAALVTGGKAQVDGDDFRVKDNGLWIYRWEGGGGWNSTTLKCWIYLDYDPKIELELGANIAGVGAVTEISFAKNSLQYQYLVRLKEKNTKLLLIGTEIFSFRNVSPTLYKVTGVKREQRWTSVGAHTAGDTVIWLQHDLQVVYGKASATAPSVNNNLKPVIDLVNSTRTSHVWTDYLDPDYPNRPGSWRREVEKSRGKRYGGRSGTYTANHNTNISSGEADEMGMRIAAYQYLGLWQTEEASIYWMHSNPFWAITDVTTSGEKYRESTSWPSTAALQKLVWGTWQDIWNQATPASAATWTPFGPTASSLSGNIMSVRYYFSGSVLKSASNIACMEVDSITETLNTNLVPIVTLGSEQTDYHLDVELENVTTGEIISVDYVAKLNETFEIDCATKTATYDDNVDAFGAVSINPDTRRVWMHLAPGANTIKYTEAGVADVDVNFTFEERQL